MSITEEQSDQIRKKRYADVREQLANWDGETGGWFWLSFAGEEGFLGAVIVKAPTPMAAFAVAHEKGINPGGEVALLPIPDDSAAVIPDHWRWRLMSRADVATFDREMKLVRPVEREVSA